MGRSAISILAITANATSLKSTNGTEPEVKWTKPEPRSVKLNVDAAFHINQGCGATAAVIRDHRGNFLAARCSFVPFAADAGTTEARRAKSCQLSWVQ